MDSRCLQQFVAVVEHGSFGRAADALHMTQSALSKSIQRLEHALKVPLLERSRSGAKPTIYGAALLPHARSVSRQLREVAQTMAALRAGMTGRVVLGAGPSLIATIVPEAIAYLARTAPAIQVEVVEGVVPELLARLQVGKLDLFVGTALESPVERQLKAVPLLRDRIAIVAGRRHRLHAREVSLPELLEQPWVLPDAENSLTRGCHKLFASHGLPPPAPAIVTNSLLCLTSLLAAGTYVSVAPMPRSEAAMLPYQPLRMSGGSWAREIWLYTHAGHEAAPTVSVAAAALRQACRPGAAVGHAWMEQKQS